MNKIFFFLIFSFLAFIANSNAQTFENAPIDPLLGSSTELMGGEELQTKIPNSPIRIFGKSHPLSINAAPYGNYNNGCVLCIAMNPNPYWYGAGRAAITQGDWRGGISAIKTENAFVGFQEYATNQEVIFILKVKYYTKKTIVLEKKLTKEQMLLIKPGMYISTNSINPQFKMNFDKTSYGLLPDSQFYQSYTDISPFSIDGSTINVIGWAAPYSKDYSLSQIPHPNIIDYEKKTNIENTIDTKYSNYVYPVVFLGAANKVFGRNLFLNYDGSRQGSLYKKNDTTSLIRRVEGEELDLMLLNLLSENAVQVRGITISTPNQSPCADKVKKCGVTKDSYAFAINTQLPQGIIAQCGNECVPLRGNGFWIHGEKGVQLQNIENPIRFWEMFEHFAYVDSIDNARLVGWVFKDKPSTLGMDGASVHLGLQKNGHAGDLSQDLGSIVFNERGENSGAVSLCGSQKNKLAQCGIKVDRDNMAYAPMGLSIGAGHALQNSTYLKKLLPTNLEDGAQVWCLDCENHGLKGVIAFWHKNDRQWSDSQNFPLK